MPEAYIYDHVRTPRGRGKADGALHELTALALATVPLQALKQGNNLAEDIVDDVALGRRDRGVRRRMADGPLDGGAVRFHAAGRLGRSDRDQIRLLARRRRCLRRA